MAVVLYQCDTCKRERQFPHNPNGLETVGRCTITLGCRGTLYQKQLLRDYQRVSVPEPVRGLDEWFKRNALYNHTQAIAQSEWVITHNMGTFPSVSTFINRPAQNDPDNLVEVTPQDIQIVDDNTVVVRFNRKESGTAQLVARQTNPQLFEPERVEQTEQQTTRQISNNGELTVATLASEFAEHPELIVDVTYQPSSGPSVTISHPVDLQPSVDSPWSDFDSVIIKGKVYKVRSFNVIQQVTGAVPTGSAFSFSQITVGSSQPQSIDINQLFILFADQPYSTVDKNTEQLIDVTSVTSTVNTFSLFYSSPELFARPNIIQQVFPPIRSV